MFCVVQSVGHSKFFGQYEDGSLDQDVFVVPHIEFFLRECECAKSLYRDALKKEKKQGR